VERLGRVSPVPPSLALTFGGVIATYRRAMIHQCRIAQSVAYFAEDEPLALAMIDSRRPRRAELAVAFRPAARRHMRLLIREAQLTLPRFRQAGILVFARIAPENTRGKRMAKLAGFRPGGFRDPAIWLWKGNGNGDNLRRWSGKTTGGDAAQATGGGK